MIPQFSLLNRDILNMILPNLQRTSHECTQIPRLLRLAELCLTAAGPQPDAAATLKLWAAKAWPWLIAVHQSLSRAIGETGQYWLEFLKISMPATRGVCHQQ